MGLHYYAFHLIVDPRKGKTLAFGRLVRKQTTLTLRRTTSGFDYCRELHRNGPSKWKDPRASRTSRPRQEGHIDVPDRCVGR